MPTIIVSLNITGSNNITMIEYMFVYYIVFVNNIMLVSNDVLMSDNSPVAIAIENPLTIETPPVSIESTNISI